jgi:hypothetical protein
MKTLKDHILSSKFSPAQATSIIQRIFEKDKGKMMFFGIFIYYFENNFLAQIRSAGLNAEDQTLLLTQRLVKLTDNLFLMSYASFYIKCHLMSNGAYDIKTIT